MVNSFSSVIQNQLYRMGVISAFRNFMGWSSVLKDAELKRLSQPTIR